MVAREMPLNQIPALAHEVNRVFCAFLLVALSPQKLDVAILIQTAKSKRDDVIHVVIGAKRLFAAGAFSPLQMKQFNGDSRC